MGLAIFLRKRLSVNIFRDLLINSIDTGLGNEVLLCSGFFQENHRGGSYVVSTEGNFHSVLLRNKINLTTVGIHNAAWLTAYRNFRNNLRSHGVAINALRSRGYRWHAKIYILSINGKPIFGIVGSSNMTRPAFSLSSPFNFEADVVMWVDGFHQFDTILQNTRLDLNENNSELIIADYDVDKNFGLSIEDRLNQLKDDVEKSDLFDLD